MRNHLKRSLAMLLVVVMVLAMLPTIAFAAGESYPITKLDAIPADGQAVVIYSASASGIFAGSADGGSIGAIAAEDLRAGEGAGVYKLTKNADGTYYITCGGKYLATDSAEKLSLQDTAITGTKWNIREVAEFGGYSISNAEVKYNGKYEIYIEYYNSFKAWTLGKDNKVTEIYTLQFWAIDEATADPNGDGYIGTKAESGDLPVSGSQYVVYNEYGAACFGMQSDDAVAPSINPVDSAKDANGKLVPGNGASIFTVTEAGGYYTFAVTQNGTTKYLSCSKNETVDGKISNAETLFFEETQSDYTLWRLEKCTGGYIMYNKVAKYGSNSVCIEYFSNAFSGWTFNGSTNLFAMKFVPVTDPYGLGFVLNPSVAITAGDANLGVDYTFSFVVDELTKLTDLKASYSVDGGAAKDVSYTELGDQKYSVTIPSAELAGKSSLTVTVNAKNEHGMEYGKTATVAINDEPMIVSVSPLPNAATKDDKQPEIAAVIANCGANPTVVMTVDGVAVQPTVTDSKVSYKSADKMTDDRHTVALTITRADGKVAEMTWSFFVGEEGMSLYFGQIHSHTAEYSDGAGTLEDAYEHAMEAKDVDFLIVTDHSNYFDTTNSATTSSYYDLSSLTKIGSTTKWEEAKATAAEYNAKSTDFIAAYGYEMTWSGGPGHTNTFNTYGPVSRNNAKLNEKTNSYAGMHLYNDLMVNADKGLDVDGKPVAEGVKTKAIDDAPVVSQFNHPGVTFGTFDTYAGYTPARDAILNLIEVGNGEGAVGGSSYWPSYSEYDICLAKGWHVAPTNNQDNHKGKWGDANTCRDVIVTDNFTEAGLYKAMANRQVYATEDQNLRIYYYLNDSIMGSIIDTADSTVDTVHITASISDPDNETLGTVEIIGANGISLKSYEATGATFELDETLKNTEPYYYIKVTQADGDIAVTAPVWVGNATPITCDLKNDVALSVEGEAQNLTSVLNNEATENYEVKKAAFYVLSDGVYDKIETVLFNNTLEGTTVAAGTARTTTVSWTPASKYVGKYVTVLVEYAGTYNGKSFKCQATMKLYVHSQNMERVAVDYGHDNYYISGDYAGSAGNFIEFCANNNVKCEYILEGQFTKETLSKYSTLVLTVNYRRNTAKAKDYTDEEIAALKEFMANGGKLIICSKSDRDNKFDNCAENTNKLLEAIGAHSRIANGIIVDNELKANEAYRIYFSDKACFNTEHRFTKGAYTSSNAFGTKPAADNQTGFQVYNGAPVLIMDGCEGTGAGKVQTLVRGFQSTWATHYDGYFDGGSFVPDYENKDQVVVEKDNVNIMTYEDTAAGGWIVTSGVTFFSNYDIKSDQDYANRFILQNILRELTHMEDGDVVTPINEVKNKTEGEYTIEGFVTSNASGYDKDTAFFDCIYVQDKNGNGLNVFPVAGNFAVGMNVRCHGGVTFYCGEIELNLSTDYNGSIRIISDEINKIQPAAVDCATAMSDAAIGNLMKVTGIVTDIHKTEGVIDKITVRDNSGEACLFINGYITKDYTGLDELAVGMKIEGTGIGSRDVDETSVEQKIFARLRVRDRSEIKILSTEAEITDVFTDLSPNAWYLAAVKNAYEKGLLNGVGDNKFDPNGTLSRAMVATVLYRMAGSPAVDSTSPFTDVPAGKWYSNAVAWAAANGVVKGTSATTFDPDADVTREQMTTMLVRYAENVQKLDVTPKGDLSGFPDGGDVTYYARNAMTWCVDNGIINGIDGRIAPKNTATRAEFATIIMRLQNVIA